MSMAGPAHQARFGRRVKYVREDIRHLTIADVADADGPSRGRMVSLENGTGTVPGDAVLGRLEKVLGLKKGSAKESLENDIDLVLEDGTVVPFPSEPVYYSEREVEQRIAFEKAMLRHNHDFAIYKRDDMFVLSPERLQQITDLLNSLPRATPPPED
ncbi:helix-turn-helix domain-containing protein [Nocardia sp. GP40]|uniref:helix-turn-helix domain-containing protein n=1 Tax=Nocardia sp. GP40 TaxID=3156268 RepID=UPI003D23052E